MLKINQIVFFSFFILFFCSCKGQINSSKQNDTVQLEINLTSNNNKVYKQLKSFTLTSLPLNYSDKSKIFRFVDVSSDKQNTFVFKSLNTGEYIGLLQIEADGSLYNISIDSIKLVTGNNVITKKLNLGRTSIP